MNWKTTRVKHLTMIERSPPIVAGYRDCGWKHGTRERQANLKPLRKASYCSYLSSMLDSDPRLLVRFSKKSELQILLTARTFMTGSQHSRSSNRKLLIRD